MIEVPLYMASGCAGRYEGLSSLRGIGFRLQGSERYVRPVYQDQFGNVRH